MKQSLLGSIMVALVAISVVLTSAGPVRGQEDPQPSREPAVFKAQLLQASQLAKRSIQEIQGLPIDDSIPVDPAVRTRARQTYVLLRAARWGMELAKQRETTYRDPMLDLAYKRVDQAFNLARYPVDYTSVPRSEYVNTSVQDLGRAVKLINQALAILP
jgi:hypothetical protein